MASGLAWFSFIILLIIIVIAIVLLVISVQFRNELIDTGIALVVIPGTTSAAVDSYTLSANNIYLGQTSSSSTLVLTLTPATDGQIGDLSYVTNTNSTQTINMSSNSSSIVFPVSSTVSPQETATFMITDDSGTWTRIR